MKLRWLLLVIPLLAVGCAAPAEVQIARAVQARALQNYLTNDAKIDGVVTGLWKSARQTEIKATADGAALKVLAAVGVARAPVDKDGKPTGPAVRSLTGAEVLEMATAIRAAIQNANAGTDRVLARIKTLRNANAANLTKHAELDRALNAYLQAGIEEAVLTELTQYLVQTIQAEVGKDK
jgi:hypothetical protein